MQSIVIKDESNLLILLRFLADYLLLLFHTEIATRLVR